MHTRTSNASTSTSAAVAHSMTYRRTYHAWVAPELGCVGDPASFFPAECGRQIEHSAEPFAVALDSAAIADKQDNQASDGHAGSMLS